MHRKARLSFSGGPHAHPVNMADSMENVSSFWIQRGYGSHKELQGFVKTWCTKYSTVQRCKLPFPFYSHHRVYRSVWPTREAKLHLDAMLIHSVHDCKTRLLDKNTTKTHTLANLHLIESGNGIFYGTPTNRRWIKQFPFTEFILLWHNIYIYYHYITRNITVISNLQVMQKGVYIQNVLSKQKI